jgi:hypothetical protein
VGAGHEGVIVPGVREGHIPAEFKRAVDLVSRCVDNQRGSQVCRQLHEEHGFCRLENQVFDSN